MRKRYRDFGPSFACEKLADEHGHRLSAETRRVWMIEDGRWQPKAWREVRELPIRPRRDWGTYAVRGTSSERGTAPPLRTRNITACGLRTRPPKGTSLN